MKIMQVFLNRFSLIRSCSLCLQFAFVVAAFSPVGETATAQENVITSHERRNDVLEAHALTLPAPIQRWDNALPLGNGLIGGLLWGEGRELRLSLDRGDLWDERGNHDVYDPRRNFQTLLLAVEKRDRETWERYFDATYNKSKWTKIPGGRLVITLPEGISTETFHLDFREALATVELTRGEKASAFFSATDRIALLRVPYGSRFAFVRPESIDKLGYPPPQIVSSDQSISYTQKTAEDLVFNFTVKWQKAGDELLVAIATATNTETRNPELKSVLDATRALVQGWTRLRDSNTSWWKNFYNASAVTIPLPRLQHHYNLVKYLYGSASRSYANPMPLQGIWTADEGGLPPWKGDYHNDLNTQMTYVAWQAAGLVDSGMSYLNYYVDRMPQFREYGRSFFGLDGAMIPGVMTLRGQAMGGWPQYAMGLTAGLWNGHAFYQYWKTYQDDDFLGGNAYPWLSEIAKSTLALTEEREGRLYLKASASPEWNDSRFEAYLTPNSNFDQALLSWALDALAEMASTLGKQKDVEKWHALRRKMPELLVDPETNALLISKGIPFEASHRHFSHALAIHPLGTLHVDQGEKEKAIVRATVRQLIDEGSSAWVGYSFTWAASLAARAGYPDDAARLLTDFERAFVSRNGFHVNGDQTNSGLSNFTYRPFTLEGNFLFMDAIHEMYLQSFTGTLHIFPAVPDDWQDCAFEDLRAEGGFLVSASRGKGETASISITAIEDATLRLQNPFPGREPEANLPIQINGELLTAELKAGQTLKLE